MSEHRISPEQSYAIAEALASIRTTQSGVRFSYYPVSQLFYLETPESVVEKGYIGQQGIKARDLEQSEKEIPGIIELLENEQGKKVFLGNGLSPVPENGVINDRFNYRLAFGDVRRMQAVLIERKLPVPPQLARFVKCAEVLVGRLDRGDLQEARYTVGTGHPPDIMKEAALVVNIHGPSIHTITEQLSLLAPGGVLAIAGFIEPYIPPGYTSFAVENPQGNRVATIIRRE